MNQSNSLEAVIFDLDGVITLTARVHAAAWQELFDGFLKERAEQHDLPFHPFDLNADYQRYVDGKPRIDGVLSFLVSRNIQIRLGDTSDSPSLNTAWGLANRKNELFKRKLQQMGVEVDHEAVEFVRELRSRGVRTGLASSSKNALLVLEKANLGSLFDAVTEGLTSERLHLKGKPEPDIFLHCLEELNPQATPLEAAVVEDAISGVAAAKRGGFGLVLGVDRCKTGDLLLHGADWVIGTFQEITADQFIQRFRSLTKAA